MILIAGASAGPLVEQTADRSVATWLAVETRTDGRVQTADLALARDLDRRWLHLATALVDGTVNLAQARVIARALDDLPETEVDRETLVRADRQRTRAACRCTAATRPR